MYPDHEFDPITPEEEAQRAQEAEFARRVRREVLRIERGEAEEEIRADLEREAEENAGSAAARPVPSGSFFRARSSYAKAYRNITPTCSRSRACSS